MDLHRGYYGLLKALVDPNLELLLHQLQHKRHCHILCETNRKKYPVNLCTSRTSAVADMLISVSKDIQETRKKARFGFISVTFLMTHSY